MIDSHCHLDSEYFGDDRDPVLARAREAGVGLFITIGVGRGLDAPREAAALAAAAPDIYATVGVHPHDAAGMTEETWAELEALARRPRVVGVGETGLDYYYDHSPRAVQLAAYRRFVALARAAGLPVVSHIREAAAFAPLDRILIETDAPYLAPVPKRGKRNEPAFLAHTLAALAEVRGMPAAELDAATSANTRRLFRLSD